MNFSTIPYPDALLRWKLTLKKNIKPSDFITHKEQELQAEQRSEIFIGWNHATEDKMRLS